MELHTVRELARRDEWAEVTIYKWIKSGELPARKLPNKTLRIREDDWQRCVASKGYAQP